MPINDANPGKRTAPATRARLRGGKIKDMNRALISTCTLYDLKNGNTGLILPDEIQDLPATFYVEDDGDMSLGLAHIQTRARPHVEIAYLDPPALLYPMAKRSA